MSADLRQVIATAIDDLNTAIDDIDRHIAVTAGTGNALDKIERVVVALNGARQVLDTRADEVRADLEDQAASDFDTAQSDDEFSRPYEPVEWFASWLDDEGPHAIAPLTEDEARKIYIAAFNRATGAS